MDREKYMILINGQDKTDSVCRFQMEDDTCKIIYMSSSKVYRYRRSKVQVLELQQRLNPAEWIVSAGAMQLPEIEELLDFDTHYRIIMPGRGAVTYSKQEISLRRNCLSNQNLQERFDYFKDIAEAIGIVTDDGKNLLYSPYIRCKKVDSSTVLACYLNPDQPPKTYELPKTILYPFGLNQSQKRAVEQALSSQVSVIQGPPGTGKTQTILNIIANVIQNGKSVAMVSNNNSAVSNVAEKLDAKELSFLAAFLGSRENKDRFLETQTGIYPDMTTWALEDEEKTRLELEIATLSTELNQRFDAKNRIATIQQELLELAPEQHSFESFYTGFVQTQKSEIKGLSSQEILSLWTEYEAQIEKKEKLGFLQKLLFLFRFNCSVLKLLRQEPEVVIPYLQNQFYILRQKELVAEKEHLEEMLEDYAFDAKMEELAEKSIQLFRAELSGRFPWKEARTRFSAESFWRDADTVNREYPVILSTTYSIKRALHPDYIYDYLIVDEASQVDLATGVLALSCARNVVIVGDLQQLPNVMDKRTIQKSQAIWKKYRLSGEYDFSVHSLLSSALKVWKDVPTVLLREHYRCHPKIINFCNQKFYGGQLMVMTEDHGESDALTMYQTAPGNHARGHLNQRQIDVIREEILPKLQKHYKEIGIITPYRDQVAAIQAQLGKEFEVATVHKFQGREKDAIVITSVDNVITDFVDDPRLLNVAVSRAVQSLTVVTSSDPRNDKTNYGDLTRYIQYNNCTVVDSVVYSVFDLLYKGYAEQRRAYLQKHKKISEYDSENLLYTVIEKILQSGAYTSVSCAEHVALFHLIKDYTMLTKEEITYAKNPLTHVDFLLFHKIDKSPLLAIEVDGTMFHRPGSVQELRDQKKNRIFEQCGIPLLRLRTDESGEETRIEQALQISMQRW